MPSNEFDAWMAITKKEYERIMKIILAGPGTGKTTKVKTLIEDDYSEAKNILVLSFTNATINDLKSSFVGFGNVNCYTLHSYALRINHLPTLHVLDQFTEMPVIEKYAEIVGIEFYELCKFLECITFSEMIKKCTQFIKSNEAYAREKIGKLDLLIVDEFQDFNGAERELVYLLSDYADETLILGDDDQSIYDFKDADPDGIIELYNGEDVGWIKHEDKCYRCPDVIVDYCTKLIGRNKNRIDKPWGKSDKAGEIIFKQILSQDETNEFICEEIKEIQSNDSNGSILILSPVEFCVDGLRTKLEHEGVDYVDFWQPRISTRQFEKIWWLRAIFSKNKALNLIFLSKVLTAHYKRKFRGVLKSEIASGFDNQRFAELVHSYFCAPFSEYVIHAPTVSDFLATHTEFSEFSEILDETCIADSVSNLAKEIRSVVEFQKGSVNVMSIHKSKGLQAEYVFITGLVDGVLPNKARGIETIEAQRRLLFVGMTRALSRLYMISTVEWEGRFVHRLDKSQFKYKYAKQIYHGRTSAFVEEMTS